MIISHTLLELLKRDDPLAEFVGRNPARIHGVAIQQGPPVYPAIVFGRTGCKRNYGMAGAVDSAHTRVQIITLAETYTEATAAADRVRVVLSGFKALLNPSPHTVRGIFLEDESDDYIPPIHDEAMGVFTVTQDYTIHHSET